MNTPASEVLDAIHAPVTSVSRRIEIYESDGSTPWRPDDDVSETLIDGSVSVDQTRDERRSIDLTLDNSSGLLKRDPRNGFWYDKIIKVFRGIEYATSSRYQSVILDANPSLYYRMGTTRTVRDRSMWGLSMAPVGFPVTVQPLLRSPDALVSTRFADVNTTYFTTDTLPSSHPAVTSNKWTLEAWVRPLGPGPVSGGVIFGRDPGLGVTHRLQVTTDQKLQLILADASSVQTVLTSPQVATSGNVYHVVATSNGSSLILYVNGDAVASGLWSGVMPNSTSPFTVGDGTISHKLRGDVAEVAFYGRALGLSEIKRHYFSGTGADKGRLDWETQVGEFMIDKIDEPRFPAQVKITGRDYTKRLLNAKLPVAMTFDPDTPIEDLIRAMAANAGITRFILPQTGIPVGDGADFDQGTDRWAVSSKICETNSYELYFNNEGYLTLRKLLDPATSPSSLTFQTGPKGNLVDWTKSSVDSEVYNRIICTSDGNSNSLPYYGEAANFDDTSPTSINRLGERTWIYTSPFFTSDQQCVDTASQFLTVKGLESFNVDFSSLVFPWTEAGEIVEFLDPDAAWYDPTRFLLTNFSLPLKLDAMTGSAKRVIIVGNL